MLEILFLISFVFLVLLGIGAALIPGIPAILYMLIVAVVFGFVDNFSRLNKTELIILAVIYLISFLTDMFSGVLGAKYGGASFRSVLFGICGAILGTVLLPPFGGFIGLFAGVLLSELQKQRTHRQAVKAATYGVIGAVAGMIVNITLSFIFFAAFITLVFFVN